MQKLPVLSICIIFLLIIFSILKQDIIFLTITTSSLIFLSFLMIKNWLSSEILLLVLMVSIFYSFGSLFNLFDSDLEYDSFLHFYTGFAVSYIFGDLIKKGIYSFRKSRFILILAIILFGLTVSIYWEIFEVVIENFLPEFITGTIADTLSDLVFDSLGILLATILITLRVENKGH